LDKAISLNITTNYHVRTLLKHWTFSHCVY